MNGSRFLLANYEALVLKVARVVLIALATISFLAITGTLVWLVITWVKPVESNYKKNLNVPQYESIDAAWVSQSVEATPETNGVEIPLVMNETVEVIDSLYQLVGREEQKFSEIVDLQEFYLRLVEPIAEFEPPDYYVVDYLFELSLYTRSMAKDELLKRIADVDVRTETIVEAMFKFRDEYVINLDGALATMEARASAHSTDRTLSSFLVLQVLVICVSAFLVSAICLLGFHIVMQRQRQNTVQTVSDTENENY